MSILDVPTQRQQPIEPTMRGRPAEILDWGPVRRVLFRFVFVYFIVYIFPSPLNFIPFAGPIIQPYVSVWDAVVPWVGEQVFGVEITVRPNGSGDTTYNYVQVFC